MITDKLLAFADNTAITNTATFPKNNDAGIDGIDYTGDEIARTMNLVAQLDDPAAVTPTTATITPKLQAFDGEWHDVAAYPAVTVAECIAGKRIVNFEKLPLGLDKYTKLRLSLTCSTAISGAKLSAFLTTSVDK